MKKLCLITAACLVSGISFAAAPMHEPTNYFNGFYLGAGVGLAHVTANDTVNGDSYTSSPSETWRWERKVDRGNYSGMLNIFGGYGRTFNQQFYLGGELFGRYMPVKIDSHYHETFTEEGSTTINADFKQKTNLDYSYGALIRGGYITSPQTMLYVLLGYERARFDIKDYIKTFEVTNIKKRHENANGIMGGLGLETYVTPKFSIRTQYTYTYYSQLKYKNCHENGPGEQRRVTTTTNRKSRMVQGLFSIDFMYHFV